MIEGYLAETDKIGIAYVEQDKNPAITKQYGVTTYGTIVLESGKKETKIQNATEENLTNALLKVTRDEQKVIYFLEGHGENQIESIENWKDEASKPFESMDSVGINEMKLNYKKKSGLKIKNKLKMRLILLIILKKNRVLNIGLIQSFLQ